MSAIICRIRTRFKVASIDCISLHNNALLLNPFHSHTHNYSSSSSSADPNRFSTVSYLITSCGLSSNDAVSLSNKLQLKSPKKPDAVLDLLRNHYGFTAPQISRIVTRWPKVLLSSPDNLSPKIEFFCSIGLSAAVLTQTLSTYPGLLHRSLEKHLVPLFNYYRSLLGSDQRAVHVLLRSRRAFTTGNKKIPSNVEMLRARGVPESSIVAMLARKPSLMVYCRERLASYVDRAAEMGFDKSKIMFMNAVEVFAEMSERTLERKMEAYRRLGWSESEIATAFLKFPSCMELSEKKITANMNFFVNELGCKPGDVARYPAILTYNLDRRIKPRCLVVRILRYKGLLKTKMAPSTLMVMSEEKFLKRYVVDFQGDIPELLDIYHGKLKPPELGFGQELLVA